MDINLKQFLTTINKDKIKVNINTKNINTTPKQKKNIQHLQPIYTQHVAVQNLRQPQHMQSNSIPELSLNDILNKPKQVFSTPIINIKNIEIKKAVPQNAVIIDKNIKQRNEHYYYFGECGFFNISIIQYLEEIMRNTKCNITMNIMPDYKELFENLFGSRIKTNVFKYTESRLHISSELDKKMTEYPGVMHIKYFINKYYPEEVMKNHRTKVLLQHHYIKSPLTYKINTITYEKVDVLIFPRNRKSDHHRNMHTDVFKKFVKLINNDCIHIIGHPNETQEITGYKRLTNFTLYMNYFKMCKIFITSDSGLKDYALNSGCRYILMYTTRDDPIHNIGLPIDCYHYTFNPFGAKIMIVRSKNFLEEIANKNIENFIKYAAAGTSNNSNYNTSNEYVFYSTKELPNYKLFQENKVYFISDCDAENIDYAIIDYDYKLFTALAKRHVTKISVFTRNEKDFENICKYSTYTVELYDVNDGLHNFILVHNSHIDDISIVITDKENIVFNRNLYFLYGRVIQSTMNEHNHKLVNEKIISERINNDNNMYMKIYLSLMGVCKSMTKYTIMTTKRVSDIRSFVKIMKNSPKICLYKNKSEIKNNLDHSVIGGYTEKINKIYQVGHDTLNNKTTDKLNMVDKYTINQLLTTAYIMDTKSDITIYNQINTLI